MELLASHHFAKRRYLSAMLFHSAWFSLLRRKVPIWPHSTACLRRSSDEFIGPPRAIVFQKQILDRVRRFKSSRAIRGANCKYGFSGAVLDPFVLPNRPSWQVTTNLSIKLSDLSAFTLITFVELTA